MTKSATLKEIESWSPDEQLELAQRIWDRLVDSGWQPTLTEAQKQELDRRLDALDANPTDVLTWDEIVRHVRRPR